MATGCQEREVPAIPDGGGLLVDPSDANALSRVLIFPDGATRSPGSPPSPSGGSAAPRINSEQAVVTSANGANATLEFAFDNALRGLGGCYVQVEGADEYARVPYGGSSTASGRLQLPLGIPTNVDAGFFCPVFCVYDTDGNVSNTFTTCVEVLRLGTGDLQISLTWDAANDQDLYVQTPSGEEIYFGNRFSADGGELDRDDTDGFGPENVFWADAAPDGRYTVEVDDYSGSGANYAVTVSGPGVSRSFSGRTSSGSRATVTSFTKSGSRITF